MEVEVESKEIDLEKEKEREALDPGLREGKKAKIDPRSTEPPTDHPRFKEVYGKMKEYERQLEDLKSKGIDNSSLVKELREHNKRLASAIENMGSSKDESSNFNKSQSDAIISIDSEITSAQNQLGNYREEKKDARDKLDYDKLDYLDEQILEIRLKIKALEEKKGIVKELKPDKVSSAEDKVDEDDIAVTDWIDDTSWFSKDVIMRGAAIALDKELINSKKWRNESTEKRLEEVKQQIEKRFNFSSNNDDDKNKDRREGRFSDVEGGEVKKGKANKSIKLSAVEMDLIKGMGVTVEQYLQQKSLISKEGGVQFGK